MVERKGLKQVERKGLKKGGFMVTHHIKSVLTPFLDTYLWTRIWELMKYRSAGERVVTGYQRSCRWGLPMTKQQNVVKSRDGD